MRPSDNVTCNDRALLGRCYWLFNIKPILHQHWRIASAPLGGPPAHPFILAVKTPPFFCSQMASPKTRRLTQPSTHHNRQGGIAAFHAVGESTLKSTRAVSSTTANEAGKAFPEIKPTTLAQPQLMEIMYAPFHG